MATRAPTRDPATLGQVRTAQLRSELKRLLALRHQAIEQGPADVLAMLRELIVVRRLTHGEIAQAMGKSRPAITMRVKPYRKEWDDAVEIGKPASWPRPFADVETDQLLADLVVLNERVTAGTAGAPEVVALNEQIRPYVTELMARGEQRAGRWNSQTGLGEIAEAVGTSRSTLARIMGWDT